MSLALKCALLGAWLAAPALACGAPEPPNVLLVLTDQHHRLSFGHAGNPIVRTPHLDRLAREGARLERVTCQTPQCLPNRMSLSTGRYPELHGVLWNEAPLRESEVTVAQRFQAAGYATAAFGKMHVPDEWLRTHGFDERRITDHYGAYLASLGITDNYVFSTKDSVPGPANAWWTGTANVPATQTHEAWATDRALEFLGRKRERPFYVTVSYYGPHAPWTPPEPYASMYRPEDMPLPLLRADDGADLPRQVAGAIERGKLQPAEAQRTMLAKYYGLVTHIDDQIGRLLDELDRLGLAEDTLVIFTSDHGEMLGEHHICGKGYYLYEANNTVALLARWPGRIRPGLVSAALVESIDVPATELDLAGLPPLESAQGRSFAGLLRGATDEHRDFVHASMRASPGSPSYVAAVADERFKLVRYHAADSTPPILFDLEQDPWELTNVHGRSEHAAATARLEAELSRWLSEMGLEPGERAGDAPAGR